MRVADLNMDRFAVMVDIQTVPDVSLQEFCALIPAHGDLATLSQQMSTHSLTICRSLKLVYAKLKVQWNRKEVSSSKSSPEMIRLKKWMLALASW